MPEPWPKLAFTCISATSVSILSKQVWWDRLEKKNYKSVVNIIGHIQA